MNAQRRDGCRKHSDKFSTRDQRCRELNRHRFDNWLWRQDIIGPEYAGNECAWGAVVGWQDPIAVQDIFKRNSGFLREFACAPTMNTKGSSNRISELKSFCCPVALVISRSILRSRNSWI